MSSEAVARDGICLFHQPDIHIRLKRILLFLRSMFKLRGYNQFLEIGATTKEIMSFHDNGFVLLRLACCFNKLFMGGSLRSFTADWKTGCKLHMALSGHKVGSYLSTGFFARSFGDEF